MARKGEGETKLQQVGKEKNRGGESGLFLEQNKRMPRKLF